MQAPPPPPPPPPPPQSPPPPPPPPPPLPPFFFPTTPPPPPPPPPLMFPRHHVFNASYPALRGIYDGEGGGGRKEDRQSTSQHWRVFSKRLIYAVQFATCIALTISLQHKLCRVNQAYDNRRYVSCTFYLHDTTRAVGLQRAHHIRQGCTV